jgi:hypothetical protein
MTIRFACRCGKKMKTSDDKIGKKVLCSACGSPVVVPSANTIDIDKVIAPASASPTAAADTASALLRGTATQEQKKTRKTIAFDDPNMDPSAAMYDATESAKYLTKSFLLPALGVLAACLVGYSFMHWITSRSSELPPLGEVTGSVYLDGVPLPGAQVTMRPQGENPQEAPKAAASVARTDEKGRFRMRYLRNVYGAPVGLCTVQITASGPDGQEVVPIRYRDRTETREVKEGNNDFDFQLKSSDQ